ncbi:4'-phosphopantetheinyl transferase family protein [Streptomyces sp. NBC_00344]|uniref:4'-phosphopantetheinyl transferase family protein n=1 Tax=Streptomyces sp. NBC_00344 TaxID=2975720 RepID=UPI002E1BE0E1
MSIIQQETGRGPELRNRGLMASLLPPQVVVRESFGRWEGDWRSALFPAEVQIMETAGDKRRREFAGVRVCARSALLSLDMPPVPLLPGPRGEPGWPAGIVGAMTHCTDYRAAAVARRAEGVASVGIDAEPCAQLPEVAMAMVATAREADHLETLACRWPQVPWGRLLFSAKESVFKAWYPLARCPLDFLETEVELWMDSGVHAGTFTAAVLRPGPFATVTGRWRITREVILTATTVGAVPATGVRTGHTASGPTSTPAPTPTTLLSSPVMKG